MSNLFKRPHFWLMLLMVLCSFLPVFMEPDEYLADKRDSQPLAKLVPVKFGAWQALENNRTQIVDPEQADTLNSIYTETLSKTFVNSSGGAVMLSLAYGPYQTEGKYLHFPAVCYPSAGYKIQKIYTDLINTEFGAFPVKKMLAVNQYRSEPVIYWAMIGEDLVLDESGSKWSRVKYGIRGVIPDGLLFRVSTVANDTEAGFVLSERFINDFLNSLKSTDMFRVSPIKSFKGQ